VQAYAQEAQEVVRYGRLQAAEGSLERRQLFFHKVWTTMLQLSTNSATALAAAYAGVLASRGALETPMVLTFLQLSTKIGEGVGHLLMLSSDVAKVSDAIGRLEAIVERKPAIDKSAGVVLDKMTIGKTGKAHGLEGAMALHNVDFEYPSRPGQPVLRGCSLELKPHCVTALVGSSGGGKSTIAALLMRFYQPGGGTVTLDGRDVSEINASWLRSQVVGVVSQDPILLPGTIRENIAYARPAASDEEVVEAAMRANAHTFISQLKDGYDTVLGAGQGGGLSVGQRQRVAIARALLKDPKVLLLDEPTSALDPESEAMVQQALDRLSTGRTVLVIAHRLSTVKKADTIMVLHDGRVAEQGNHDELVGRGGLYAEMVRMQTQAKREGAAASKPLSD